MRAGRLLLLAIGLLLAAAVAAVALVPPMLDWNRYRDDIAGLVSRGIDRPVRITGDVSLSLLPEPVLTASGMTVADNGDGIALSAESLRLRVALGALLAGRVDARELTVRGATLRLPWPPAPGALAQRPPSWLSGLQARVENSRLQVGQVAFTDIAGTLSTDPDTGTLSANGGGRLNDQAWRVIARLSEPGRDGTAALDASVDGENRLRDTGGTFSGQIGADGALSGRATARGPDLSLLLPAPHLPWTAEGRLSASAGLAVADELQITLAGTPARGAVALRVGPDARLDVALATNRLDGDAWWPVLLRGASPSLPTGVDLSAEAATLANGQLRRLRAGLDLGPDGAVVREATAELPGGATLNLAGIAGHDGGFHGTGRLSAPDLRATLRWLEPSVPGLAAIRPDDALRTGQLTATVAAEFGAITFTDLKGVIDGATLAGSASFKPGARPAFTCDLQAERLDLGPFLPEPDPRQLLPNLARRFAPVDVTLRVRARNATWRGLPVTTATLDLSTENSRLTLRQLQARLGGIRLTASGTLGDNARLTDGILDATADDAAPLATLLPPAWSPLETLLHGPATLTIRAAGPPEALSGRLMADLSDIHLEAAPVVDTNTGRVTGTLAVHHPGAPRLLRVLGLDTLANAVGEGSFSFLTQVVATPGELRLDPLQLSAGSTRIAGALAATLRGTPAISGRLTAESLAIPTTVALSTPLPTGLLANWRATLRLEAKAITLAGRRLATDLATNATLADNRLTLANGTATLSGAPATFDLSLDAGVDPPTLTTRAALTGAALPNPPADPPAEGVTLYAGSLDSRLDLHAAGHSPAALLTTLSGQAHLTIHHAQLQGMDLPAASQAAAKPPVPPLESILDAVRTALTSGTGTFALWDTDLSVQNGLVTLDHGVFTDAAGSTSVTGTFYVPTATLDARITRPATRDAPGYAVALTGAPPHLIRTPELAGLARQLAEAPTP